MTTWLNPNWLNPNDQEYHFLLLLVIELFLYP